MLADFGGVVFIYHFVGVESRWHGAAGYRRQMRDDVYVQEGGAVWRHGGIDGRSCKGEAVLTALYILNRSPTEALNGSTPYEAWHGRKPAVSHLRVFGCIAFAKELGHIGKLDGRSIPGVFIGYSEGSKAYHILDPKTHRESRQLFFAEHAYLGSQVPIDPGGCYTNSTTVSDATYSNTDVHSSGHVYTARWSSLSHGGERIDVYHDGEPLRYPTMENLLGDHPLPGLVPHDLEAQLQLACDDGEPQSFAEAERGAAWCAAM
ncbi:hypothetical protein QYE76_037880 [Lolium multiflorum]|uniref:Retroviral polymerase SH3-like domain-containing protein n=1 Tax=Lolium multiflorum TaxID=4521 RepID=A0AAD8T802_LOLMU|nr:hypothetical protein QYE76_037880 [Lolium multiflorum]